MDCSQHGHSAGFLLHLDKCCFLRNLDARFDRTGMFKYQTSPGDDILIAITGVGSLMALLQLCVRSLRVPNNG